MRFRPTRVLGAGKRPQTKGRLSGPTDNKTSSQTRGRLMDQCLPQRMSSDKTSLRPQANWTQLSANNGRRMTLSF
ncbi:hypothetical protein J6590_076675 [Homalodisca vitripennis]|nr:hypothetical protein J6590_076675 [Homalodisca vitripennis]